MTITISSASDSATAASLCSPQAAAAGATVSQPSLQLPAACSCALQASAEADDAYSLSERSSLCCPNGSDPLRVAECGSWCYSSSKLCASLASLNAVAGARWASSAFLLAFIPEQVWKFVLRHHCPGICPHKSCALAAIRGMRQGFVYGVKVRFPHALVMTVLFGVGSVTEKALSILSMTGEHARVLSLFVLAYKAVQCVFRHVQQQNTAVATMASGALAGAAVFVPFGGSPLVGQVHMYLLSRLVFALGRAMVARGWVPESSHRWAFPLFAGVSWALGMYLFVEHDYSLQRSVKDSMGFLYLRSNQWPRDAESVLEWMVREP